jgi:hypothetical protein
VVGGLDAFGVVVGTVVGLKVPANAAVAYSILQ